MRPYSHRRLAPVGPTDLGKHASAPKVKPPQLTKTTCATGKQETQR